MSDVQRRLLLIAKLYIEVFFKIPTIVNDINRMH